MTGLFAYPQATAFGRVVPKQRFYEHTNINPKVRELFVSEVRRITWAYKLAPETIGLSGSSSVPEIQVFTVELKDLDLNLEVLAGIDRAVRFPIIFEVRRERAGMAEVRVVAAHKVLGAHTPKVSAYFAGDWQGQDAVRAPLPVAVNLAGLYAQLLGPLQLVLILAYVRAGEFIWRADPMPLSVTTLVSSFRADPWPFLQRFGLTGVHAATAWLLSVPLIVATLYFSLRPAFHRFAKK